MGASTRPEAARSISVCTCSSEKVASPGAKPIRWSWLRFWQQSPESL